MKVKHTNRKSFEVPSRFAIVSVEWTRGSRDKGPEKIFPIDRLKMAVTVEPVRVSPFIKFCRWGFLVAGIFYGMTRFEALSRKQKAIRDNFDKDRVERQAREAAEKKRKSDEDINTLMNVFKVS